MEDNEDGFSLDMDIKWMKKFDPTNVLFFITDNMINGFLAYSISLSAHVWGYILNENNVEKVFNALFLTLQRLNKNTKLAIRVNSESPLALNILKNFKISKVLIRMVTAEGFNISKHTSTNYILSLG